MWQSGASDRSVFLSLLPARPEDKKLAAVVLFISALGFLIIAPFAKIQLPRVDAFVPLYQGPLALNDLITATLLYGQFSIVRSRSLLFLASAYLFTALMVVAHLLSFPGLLGTSGVIGGGPHSTAWLYMIWHIGFPLLVMGYAYESGRKASDAISSQMPTHIAILSSILVVALVALAATLMVTAGHGLLLPVMAGSKTTPVFFVLISVVWACGIAAIVMLWRRKPHSTLDIWLMVALCAWLIDVALGAMLNAGRFDLGFYSGRIYGLMAASFVLVLLLLETRALYSRLAKSLDSERIEAQRRRIEVEAANLALQKSEQRLKALNETLEERIQERSRQLEAETATRARAQDALRETQKLEAIGRMAGGIAHDFNNLLTIIVGNAEFLETSLQNGAEQDSAKAIGKAADRGVQLVRKILAFSRTQTLHPEVIDLRERRAELAEMLERTVRNDVQVHVNFSHDLKTVECDAGELELALMNLCVNARDAMPGGGLVQIEGRNVILPSTPEPGSGARISSAPDAVGPFVAISVSDAGSGIAPSDLLHVLEPFFTTKALGKGTGLGLSQVYGFVQQANGLVTIDTAIGTGTVVTMYFPPFRGTAQSLQEGSKAEDPRGAGKILLLEDDEGVAKMASTMLTGLGYEVHRVSEPRTALAVLLGGQKFDLLFSDIVMPGGINGLELARKVRQHFPSLPILLTTGYSSAAANVYSEGFPLIAKPYRRDTLAAAIESAIGEASSMRGRDSA
jgi:signal transduction histidine kinase/CheY-like chemotaxis protein